MVENCRRWSLALIGLGAMLLSPGVLGQEETRAVLAGVRLGDHQVTTRIVLDLKNGDAAYAIQLSDDRQRLLVTLQAGVAQRIPPHRATGLVRSVTVKTVGDATQVVITSEQPVRLAGKGALAPTAGIPYHRIYLDLAAAPIEERAQPPAPLTMAETPAPEPIPEAEPPGLPATPEATPRALPTKPESTPHRLVFDATQQDGADHHDAEGADASAIVKIGGSQEWSLSSADRSSGPTLAVEKAVLRDSVEIEAGVTPLITKGRAEWKTGLIVKKPFEIAERTDLEVGLGPLWLHRTDGDSPVNRAGAEAVVELVNWPWESRKLGWYVESGYAYDFGKGNEKSLGLGAGLLIAIP